MRLTKKIGFYDFFVFKCPSERYKKWQLHMNTLYVLVSVPVALTILGLGYMIRCEIRKKCCKCCVDLEKEDRNLDYGTYYDHDGERRQDVMEVTSLFPS